MTAGYADDHQLSLHAADADITLWTLYDQPHIADVTISDTSLEEAFLNSLGCRKLADPALAGRRSAR